MRLRGCCLIAELTFFSNAKVGLPGGCWDRNLSDAPFAHTCDLEVSHCALFTLKRVLLQLYHFLCKTIDVNFGRLGVSRLLNSSTSATHIILIKGNKKISTEKRCELKLQSKLPL
jgi:hypothetical protein